MFVNTMHSVHFYFVNTKVMYQFTALVKITYIADADAFKLFFHIPFSLSELFYKSHCLTDEWPKIAA